MGLGPRKSNAVRDNAVGKINDRLIAAPGLGSIIDATETSVFHEAKPFYLVQAPVFDVLCVCASCLEDGLADVANQRDPNLRPKKEFEDLQVIAGEVLDLVDVDLIEDLFEPVDS